MGVESTDVIVVGTRCAGTAVATALARAGRRVVGLDSSTFPSDTLSTHLLWPSGLHELAEVGALSRVLALGAPRLSVALAAGAGHVVAVPFATHGGADYAMCIRRIGLDAALVETAREAGAEVRERVRVTALVHRDGRIAGVRYVDRGGEEHVLNASLVVGADGRRSTVAHLVGSATPYRSRPSGRSCFYAYWTDPHDDWREVAAQWRSGASLGTAFPCDGGLLLSLVQPPSPDVGRIVGRGEEQYRAMIADIPGLAARLEGCTLHSRVRSAVGIVSYFRRSSGPGWALPGDAGHFKDPVTAQGIRDALRYGRLLGEMVADRLDDPVELDRQLARWEIRREAECLEVYQYTNRLARGEEMTPLEIELYRAATDDPSLGKAMIEVLSRSRAPRHLVGPVRRVELAARSFSGPQGRVAALSAIGREARDILLERAERIAALRDAQRRVG